MDKEKGPMTRHLIQTTNQGKATSKENSKKQIVTYKKYLRTLVKITRKRLDEQPDKPKFKKRA